MNKSKNPYRPRHWLLPIGMFSLFLYVLADSMLPFIMIDRPAILAAAAGEPAQPIFFENLVVILGTSLCFWSATLAFVAYGVQWLVTLTNYFLQGGAPTSSDG